jgi:hypothetical protein
MADSDNTTSLPFVTPRGRDQADVSPHIIARASADEVGLRTPSGVDPVLALAERWRKAHANALELCARHQAIETKLIAEFGSCPPDTQHTSRSERWASADRNLGYSATQDAERRAVQDADRILDQLMRTPASSLQGVIAKLEVVLLESETGDGPTDFPWPQIRSVVADLKRQITIKTSQQTSHI